MAEGSARKKEKGKKTRPRRPQTSRKPTHVTHPTQSYSQCNTYPAIRMKLRFPRRSLLPTRQALRRLCNDVTFERCLEALHCCTCQKLDLSPGSHRQRRDSSRFGKGSECLRPRRTRAGRNAGCVITRPLTPAIHDHRRRRSDATRVAGERSADPAEGPSPPPAGPLHSARRRSAVRRSNHAASRFSSRRIFQYT